MAGVGLHAYCYGLTVFVPENHGNQWRVPEILIASQKFPDPVIYEKKTIDKHCLFRFFPESSWSVCAGTYQSHFWTCCTCAKYRNNACLLSEVFCAWVKDTKQNKFLQSFCKAASRIDLNRGAICKNVLCTMESMAESIDHAPVKPSPAKRRRFQMLKKVHHEKWSLATVDQKADTCVNS